VLIGVPMYNFSVPAALKAWIDRISFVPYLRKYFTNLGIAEDNLTFVCADLTRSADIPQIVRCTPLAATSLAAARRTVIELASTLGEAVGPAQISST
jgi:FMN-dependent NADH-azoreductase